MFQARPSLFGNEVPIDLEALLNDKKKTLVINQPATHLPDLVVFVDHSKKMPFQLQFQAVVLFLDISGQGFSMSIEQSYTYLQACLYYILYI